MGRVIHWSYVLLALGLGFLLGLIVRLPFLAPLPNDLLQFFSMVGAAAASLGAAYILWSAQQRHRRSSVAHIFKEIFRNLSGYIDSIGRHLSLDKSVNPVLANPRDHQMLLDRRPRPLIQGVETSYEMSDEDVLYRHSAEHARHISQEAIDALRKALDDYEHLKQLLPDLNPREARDLINLRRIAGESLEALISLREMPLNEMSRRTLILQEAQIETLRGVLNDWTADLRRLYG